MRRFALAAATLLLTTMASAQIYQWKDENGKTVISDKPPIGTVPPARKIDAAPTSSTPKSVADKDLEFRKRQKEQQETSEKTEKEQTAAAENTKNCDSARRYLQTLESGERIAMRDDKGERYFMEDAQREQEIASARQALQSNCSK